MKSLTKKLSFLFLLSITFLLTSCLDSSAGFWKGENEFSYITYDKGTNTTYARTEKGYFITSQFIETLEPGTTASISYYIDFDESEQIVIGSKTKAIIYKVRLAAEPEILNQTKILSSNAPVADTTYFENLEIPQRYTNFSDRWPINFWYKAKKGEKVRIILYKVAEEDFPEDFSDDVLIDIRIEKFGTPEESSKDELKADFFIADMSSLKWTESDESSQDPKQLSVKFRYFRSDLKKQLYISRNPFTITLQE